MPYLGNPAQQRFSSPRAASVYSGDGSTVAFTLEEVVTTDEDILVSVDGVIQEPSVAYAVSSGTTLTFTAAPSTNSGNNIFVYYIARTFGSISMPDGQNVNATNGTFSGTFAAAGGAVFNEGSVDVDFRAESNNDTHALFINGANGNIGLGTASPDASLHIEPPTGTTNASLIISNSGRSQYFRIQNNETSDALVFNSADSAEVMKIDSTGAVTKPLQPAFLVQPSSAQSNIALNAYATIAFATEIFDNNADFASNTFTAPVTGKYQFNCSLYFTGIDTDTTFYQLYITTSNRNHLSIIAGNGFAADPSYHSMNHSVLTDMDASDTCYIRLQVSTGGAATADLTTQTRFSGYLVA